MGDHATTNNPTTDPAFEKGKGKATDPTNEMSMDEEDSSSESEPEVEQNEEDEDMDNNLEPIDQSNIIQGGRRTRGKVIDYANVAEQNKGEMDDEDEDDEEYEGAGDEDHEMRG
ncbi:hypothetical protein N7478_007961 [Penicillium angulare]|uniref:uncharacterized protein n=1 Tax=Penicillium angulare TaxID=116970 RepID=UPI0025407043|nr:uncharacterized protein N7478_007961 [Penicillium angulare]KAJ5272836.1 hypothetical protein N7478_007961 [Penicillium angulare]